MKHIVLITIDALRRDHCSCYGYPVRTTPFLSSLAEKGVKFNRVFATGTNTFHSFPAIFCGIHWMESGSSQPGIALPASEPTLAERLSEIGYITGGFQAGNPFLVRAKRYHRGFHVFKSHIPVKRTEENLREYEDKLLAIMNSEDAGGPATRHGTVAHSGTREKPPERSRERDMPTENWTGMDRVQKAGADRNGPYPLPYRWIQSAYHHALRWGTVLGRYYAWRQGTYHGNFSGDLLNLSVQSWLSQTPPDQPRFLWVHYMDTHDPFVTGPSDTVIPEAPTVSALRMIRYSLSPAEYPEDPVGLEEFLRLYDRKIRSVDAHIEDLFRILREHDITENNALFLITADHGDEFWDHGSCGHGYGHLYNELLHVPFILYGSGSEQYAPYADAVISLRNVPDILLNAAAENVICPAEKQAYSLTRENLSYKAAVQDQRYKLILKNGTPETIELYDLEIDPGEKVNQSGNPDLQPVRQVLEEDVRRYLRELDQKTKLKENLKRTRENLAGLKSTAE